MKSVRHWLFLTLAAGMIPVEVTHADPVLDWDALMMNAIRADNTGPTLSTRNLAILHTAIYDAVNSVARTHQAYRFQLDSPPATSMEAAAVAAGHTISVVLYPSFRAQADAVLNAYLADAPPDASLTNGLALGRDIANQTLASRMDDGSNTAVPYIPSDAPGQWRRTPPFFRPPLTPHWRYVRPFAVPELEPFVPPPPPPLESSDYAAGFNVVQAIGGKVSLVRTDWEAETAVFWSDFSYTAMPPGHWHEIATTIARDRGGSLVENARLLALMAVTEADAAIVCWEGKYRYNLWRPVTAIQRADEDQNPATEADPTWDHLLDSPPFPSYPSGHSTFSRAGAELLTRYFGTDAITFVAHSDSLPDVDRTYHSLSDCANEVGLSRIYGGFHFPFDDSAGQESGRKIAAYVSANYLLPVEQLPQVRIEGLVDGQPLLRVHGHLGSACLLEASSDLAHWESVASGTAVPGGRLIKDAGAPPGGVRFYRVVEGTGSSPQ